MKRILSCISLIFISLSANAGPNVEPVATHSPVYFNVGVEYGRLHFPEYFLPMTMGAYQQSPDGYAPAPSSTKAGGYSADQALTGLLGLGYHFQRPWYIPSFFGSLPSVEFNFDYFHADQYFVRDLNGEAAAIWSLDSNETTPIDPGAPSYVDTTDVQLVQRYNSATLYLKGVPVYIRNHIYSTPQIGLVYGYLRQDATYDINWTDAGIENKTVGSDHTMTRYWGGGLGERLDYSFTPKVSWFVDGNFQLFYALSDFAANQVANENCGNTTVQCNEARYVTGRNAVNMAFRAKISTGPAYYFDGIDQPESPIASLRLGVDEWGYVPVIRYNMAMADVAMPPPHLATKVMRNYFVGANITYPFG